MAGSINVPKESTAQHRRRPVCSRPFREAGKSSWFQGESQDPRSGVGGTDKQRAGMGTVWGRGSEQVQRGPLVLCGPVRRSVPPAGQIIQTLGAEEAREMDEVHAGQCKPAPAACPSDVVAGAQKLGQVGSQQSPSGGGDGEACHLGAHGDSWRLLSAWAAAPYPPPLHLPFPLPSLQPCLAGFHGASESRLQPQPEA